MCVLRITGKRPPHTGNLNRGKFHHTTVRQKLKSLDLISLDNKVKSHSKMNCKSLKFAEGLSISFHQPTADGIKDILKYTTKITIIKIGYALLSESGEENKSFDQHESLLFNKDENLDFDILKKEAIIIDRNKVMNYVKQCFERDTKIDIAEAISLCVIDKSKRREE